MTFQPSTTNNYTSTNNINIIWHKWNSVSSPKAIVVISHGFGEHVLRYQHVAKHFTDNGFVVYGLDYRGHGASGGDQANIQHISHYQPDLAQLIELAKAEHSDLPCFLFGHSMGGAIALGYALEEQDSLTGLLLSASYLKNAAPVSPLLINLAKVIAKIAPNLPTQAVDSKAISRNPDEVKAYEDDPLVYSGKVKAAMGNALIGIGPELLARASQLTLPTLIMHGEADTIADYKGSQELFETVSCPDKNLKLYPESYHEILNDYDQAKVLEDITEWLKQRI